MMKPLPLIGPTGRGQTTGGIPMAPSIVAAAIEYRDIHEAACRYRRQGLVCSTCTELAERAERAIARAAAQKREAA